MRFRDALDAGRFPVALEITPPRKPSPAILQRRAGLLGDRASAINVIQRTGRQPSLDAALALGAAGLAPVWHLVTRGRSLADIQADLGRAAAGDIDMLLCIRGDTGVADLPETPTIRDTIALAREHLPSALIGATMNQYAPREAALRNLLPKLHAGASYVQTQPVFELEALLPMAERVKHGSPATTRVVAMAMPLLSAGSVAAIESRLGVSIGPRVPAALAAGPDAGWQLFAETLAALAASPLIDGVAIMTFETDPTPETGGHILDALRSAGLGG